MCSPHRDHAHGFAAPHPDKCEIETFDLRGCFPSFLIIPRRRMMDGGPTIEESVGGREIQRTLLDYLRAL
jgi:hypothetical protein